MYGKNYKTTVPLSLLEELNSGNFFHHNLIRNIWMCKILVCTYIQEPTFRTAGEERRLEYSTFQLKFQGSQNRKLPIKTNL